MCVEIIQNVTWKSEQSWVQYVEEKRGTNCGRLTKSKYQIKNDIREGYCENKRREELFQDCAQWWAFVLEVLNLPILLPEG
jgi:hypothetical protein